jgi:uncharacterized phiE125 gp8 family phage protein
VVTLISAAPIDGLAALPDDLINQYVKPHADQAALITVSRLAALGWVEQHTSHSLSLRRWIAMFDSFSDTLRLPREPVRNVLSVGYVDPSGVARDAEGSWQFVGSHLIPAAGSQWPETARRTGAVIVTFEAGYEDLAIEAPALQIAALMMVQHLFAGGSLADVPTTIALLIDTQYRTPVLR